ncbi:MAG: hypothetical protein NVS3B1_26770 [Marmoricola sp.]
MNGVVCGVIARPSDIWQERRERIAGLLEPLQVFVAEAPALMRVVASINTASRARAPRLEIYRAGLSVEPNAPQVSFAVAVTFVLTGASIHRADATFFTSYHLAADDAR